MRTIQAGSLRLDDILVADVNLSDYLPLSGGTLTGNLSVKNADVNILSGRFSGGENAAAIGKSVFAYGDSVSAIGDNSYAIGKNSIAGCYGWYYKYVDFATGTFYLCNEQPTQTSTPAAGDPPEVDMSFDNSSLAVGDQISYVNIWKHDLVAKIQSIEGNKIVVGPLDDIVRSDSIKHDDWSFFIPSKPTAGTVWLGEVAYTEGYKTKAINAYSHAEGRDTLAFGQYGHAEGRNTKAGYACHAEGENTYAYNTRSHAEGYAVSALGDYSHAEGRATLANEQFSHAAGFKAHANELMTWVWSQDIADKSHDDTHIYSSHGPGTFNINPADGLSGFYVGNTNVGEFLAENFSEISEKISEKISYDPFNIYEIRLDSDVAATITDEQFNFIQMMDKININTDDTIVVTKDGIRYFIKTPANGQLKTSDITDAMLDPATEKIDYIIVGNTVASFYGSNTGTGQFLYGNTDIRGVKRSCGAVNVFTTGNQALRECTSLLYFNCGPKVNYSSNCLMNCTSLVAASINCVNSSFSWNAFKQVPFSKIIFPKNITEILDRSGFQSCNYLKTIQFEKDSLLTTVSTGAFLNCARLHTVIFPESITTIKVDASNTLFNGCSRLSTLVFKGKTAAEVIANSNFNYSNWSQVAKDALIDG